MWINTKFPLVHVDLVRVVGVEGPEGRVEQVLEAGVHSRNLKTVRIRIKSFRKVGSGFILNMVLILDARNLVFCQGLQPDTIFSRRV